MRGPIHKIVYCRSEFCAGKDFRFKRLPCPLTLVGMVRVIHIKVPGTGIFLGHDPAVAPPGIQLGRTQGVLLSLQGEEPELLAQDQKEESCKTSCTM